MKSVASRVNGVRRRPPLAFWLFVCLIFGGESIAVAGSARPLSVGSVVFILVQALLMLGLALESRAAWCVLLAIAILVALAERGLEGGGGNGSGWGDVGALAAIGSAALLLTPSLRSYAGWHRRSPEADD